MTNPNETISPQAARASTTGTRRGTVLDNLVKDKAAQAAKAVERPLHAMLMGVGHAILGLGFGGIGYLCVYLKAPWWAPVICGFLALYAAAPTSVSAVVKWGFATAGDVKDKFMPAKEPS